MKAQRLLLHSVAFVYLLAVVLLVPAGGTRTEAAPVNPRAQNVELVGFLPVGHATDVAVVGNYAYIAADTIFQIVDVSNPTSPTLVGSLPVPADNLVVRGNFAYVHGAFPGGAFSGIRIVDVTDPTRPSLVAFFQTPCRGDLDVVGNLAFVADNCEGLLIIDLSNGTVIGRYQGEAVRGLGLAVVGTTVYLGQAAFCILGTAPPNGLSILSVENPAEPALVGFVPLLCPSGVAVEGDRVYIANGFEGLHIIGGGSFDTPGFARTVAAASGHAYVADIQGGLRVISADSGEVGFYEPGDTTGMIGVAVAGNFVYATGDGFYIFGVRLPQEFTFNVTTFIPANFVEGPPQTRSECRGRPLFFAGDDRGFSSSCT